MATLLWLSTLILMGNEGSLANVWPGFLGAGATAIPAESVPLEWAPDQNLAWKAELAGESQSSPIVRKGQVDFFGKDGRTTVLATAPEHKQLAVNRTWRIEDVDVAGVDPGATRFGGPIQYGVAVAHGSFFVRTGYTLYCIRQAN